MSAKVELSGATSESKIMLDADSLMQADSFCNLEGFVGKVYLTSETKEMRHIHRVLRKTFAEYRRKWNTRVLLHLVDKFISESSYFRPILLSYFSKDLIETLQKNVDDSDRMQVDNTSNDNVKYKEFKPEIHIYISLLILVLLLDNGEYEKACALSDMLVTTLEGINRRTLDPLSAKVYFYYSRSYELSGQLSDIRKRLFSLLRTAILHHNNEGQTSLLNLLLRNLLHFNLYEQASKLVSKTEFNVNLASSNELARYYYYQGRIKSVDPEQYRIAFEYLQQALRKAPTTVARGFRVAIIKLACIVQLLIGEIPERSLLLQRGLMIPLKPYLQLTSAVRYGDLSAFQCCIEEHKSTFIQDNTINLIQRMRNNVIRTGLHKINISYSRISLKDICQKLKLDSIEDAEFIVSKAIKDNIIDATINHAGKFIASKETLDVYSTKEPQEQFHARIQFFLDIHNDAMKAMRYLPNYRKNFDSEEVNQKIKDDEELAAALADEDDDYI